MRIAILQFSPTVGVLEPNLVEILNGIDRAARAGAGLFVAPEMSLTGWTLRAPALRSKLAAAVRETALPALRDAAVKRQMGVVVGGPCEVIGGADRRATPGHANAVFGLAPDGSSSVYKKMHLFGEERDWWLPGHEAVVLTMDRVSVGVTICYDAEFPEVPRMTRLAGADLLVVPTTNMTPYEADQDLIFATRALENECPVAVANRVGSENDWSYFGRSLIADQRGRIVAQAGSEEQLLVADVELSMPIDPALSYMARRRPEAYGPLVQPVTPYEPVTGRTNP